MRARALLRTQAFRTISTNYRTIVSRCQLSTSMVNRSIGGGCDHRSRSMDAVHHPSVHRPIEFRTFVFARKIASDKCRMLLILCVFALHRAFVVCARDGQAIGQIDRTLSRVLVGPAGIMNINICRPKRAKLLL